MAYVVRASSRRPSASRGGLAAEQVVVDAQQLDRFVVGRQELIGTPGRLLYLGNEAQVLPGQGLGFVVVEQQLVLCAQELDGGVGQFDAAQLDSLVAINCCSGPRAPVVDLIGLIFLGKAHHQGLESLGKIALAELIRGQLLRSFDADRPGVALAIGAVTHVVPHRQPALVVFLDPSDVGQIDLASTAESLSG